MDEKLKRLRSEMDALRAKFTRKKVKPSFKAEDESAKAPHPLERKSPGIVYQRDLPRNTPKKKQRHAQPAPSAHAAPLTEAVPGEEFQRSDWGSAYVARTPVESVEDAGKVATAFQKASLSPKFHFREHAPPSAPTPMERFIFMDVESTGLGSATLFLIGCMVWHNDDFEVRQYLARNYAEEACVIRMFLRDCESRSILVTFNGKSFDFPFIRMRSAASGVPFALDMVHIDLLHASRRVWRNRLPDCKLQTLEKHVCGRLRFDDIPGDQIGEAYHQFVRSGDASRIADIIEHNRLDLITLADLMSRFPEVA